MPPVLLLDTGPWVALIDRSEEAHGACREVLEGWPGTLVTTEAVLTVTLHLLGPSWHAQRSALDFVLRGAVLLVPATPESLARTAALMEKYRDAPMELADATLVALGEEIPTEQVFTLDRRGFSAYRLRGRRAFRIHP